MFIAAGIANYIWGLNLDQRGLQPFFYQKVTDLMVPDSRLIIRRLIIVVSMLLMLGSAVIVLSAIFHYSVAVQTLLHLLPVRINTALGLFFIGLALVLFSKGFDRAGLVVATLITMVGVLVSIESFVGFNIGADQLLLSDLVKSVGLSPRISPVVCLIFLATGLGLLFNKKTIGLMHATDLSGFFVTLVSLISVIGYIYQVPYLCNPHMLFGLKGLSGLAFLPACFFLLIGGMLLSFRPTSWLSSVWTGKSRGCELIRTFLPTFIGLPLLLGLCKNYFSHMGLLSDEVGVSIVVIMMILVAAVAVIRLGTYFDKVDMEKAISVEQREDLLYAMAHDMKVPLIGSDRLLGLIVDGKVPDAEAQKNYLHLVQQSNESLLWMIQNIIYEHRRQNGQEVIRRQETELYPFVSTCISQIQPLAESKGLQLQCDVDQAITCLNIDPDAMKRVLLNLMHNAVKFTQSGSIKVSSRTKGGKILLAVSDTGIGISKEDQEHLFEKFYQAEAGRNHANGSGLGLHLCRQIMDAHGGHITCRSVPGEGTVFTLEFPIAA